MSTARAKNKTLAAWLAVNFGANAGGAHAPLLAAFPFARWNRAERMVAPPLVLHVKDALCGTVEPAMSM
mgnify:CR=1 FL=1